MFVVLTALDILRDQLRRTEQHTLEVGLFGFTLHLDEQQVTVLVLRQQVHAITLGVLVLLIAFAFEEALDGDGSA